jgi:hypothetical protein
MNKNETQAAAKKFVKQIVGGSSFDLESLLDCKQFLM